MVTEAQWVVLNYDECHSVALPFIKMRRGRRRLQLQAVQGFLGSELGNGSLARGEGDGGANVMAHTDSNGIIHLSEKERNRHSESNK